MKLLLVLLVVLLGAWLWRSKRAARRREPPSSPPPARGARGDAPQEMVACGLCGVHVPRAEAIAGRSASYCCAEHRQRAEP